MEDIIKEFYAQRGVVAPIDAGEFIGLRTFIEQSIKGTDYCPFPMLLPCDPATVSDTHPSPTFPEGDNRSSIRIPPPEVPPRKDRSPSAPHFTMGSATTPGPSRTSATSSGTSGQKRLTQNLNGQYTWKGLGSTRGKKNRHQSSAFGPSNNAHGPRLSISPPSAPPLGSKRRRLATNIGSSSRVRLSSSGSSASTSTAAVASSLVTPSSSVLSSSTSAASTSSIASSAPSSSATKPRAPSLAPPAHITPPVYRIGISPNKPTTPVNPSPLRNSWNSTDSPPSPRRPATNISRNHAPNPNPSSSNSSNPMEKSYSAEMMKDAIKDATEKVQPTKEDTINPWEQPEAKYKVPKVPKKKGLKTKALAERLKKKTEAAIEAEKEKERQKELEEMSIQRIIEATVPKVRIPPRLTLATHLLIALHAVFFMIQGAKRARPPPGFVSKKPSTSSSSTSSSRIHGIYGDSAPRRQQPTRTNGITSTSFFGGSSTTTATITAPVIEEDDLAGDWELEPPSPKKQKTQPKRDPTPSNSNVSVEEIEDVEMMGSTPIVTKPSEVVEPSGSGPSVLGPAFTMQPKTGKGATPGLGGIKSSAPKEPSKLRFSLNAADQDESPSASPSQATAALAANGSSASSSSSSFTFGPQLGAAPPKPSPTFGSALSPIPEVPSAPASAVTTPAFGTAPLPSFGFDIPPTTKDSSDSMKAAKALPTTSLPTFAFFAFAVSTVDGPDVVMSEADNQSEKTSARAIALGDLPSFVFDIDVKSKSQSVPFSAFTSITAPVSSKGGFDYGAAGLTPPPKANNQWTCSLCSCKNDEAATKCSVCDEKKPVVAPKAAGGFDWAAAGMKAPEKNGGHWTCTLCALKNEASATQCSVCETKKPVEAPTPASGGGFDWAAAGMQAPQVASGSWTCSLCACSNTGSAAKCSVCDEKRP